MASHRHPQKPHITLNNALTVDLNSLLGRAMTQSAPLGGMHVLSQVPSELHFRYSFDDGHPEIRVPHYGHAPCDAWAHRGLGFYVVSGVAPNIVSLSQLPTLALGSTPTLEWGWLSPT